MKSAAVAQAPKPAAPPPIPYDVGSVVSVKHPGFSDIINGKVIKHCNAEHMLVESPNGFRLYTHHKFTLKHTPDLLGEIRKAEANGNAGNQSTDHPGENEPDIVPERYFALLRSWCQQDHHTGNA